MCKKLPSCPSAKISLLCPCSLSPYICHSSLVCTQKLINDLFKLQKSAIRIICNVNFNSHMEPLFIREDILPLPDLIHFFKVQFMHRFSQKNFLPTSFDQLWIRNNVHTIGENEIQLRNQNHFKLPPPELL